MPTKDDPRMLATLRSFNRAMGAQLGMPQEVDEDVTEMYLALTGAAANEIVRPAAPFSALFAGWLYGSGRADSLEEAAAMVGEALRTVEVERPA
ncbi:DUF6457 domain-containing protein [Brachybacterium huguangmaarense]|uniref:DUF6457 domain-containing protein n=1 Tax=Brachybacterium huguangmaarense TaxID=1652028 RepID=A0ABY6G3C6_9MICO|nr:DUF6457 domain-containing protein [Brachybacterium huguangmaarense]UYG17143.1 DUF6457 domain-containing protein [Brachybacterium huguangmaarense]